MLCIHVIVNKFGGILQDEMHIEFIKAVNYFINADRNGVRPNCVLLLLTFVALRELDLPHVPESDKVSLRRQNNRTEIV